MKEYGYLIANLSLLMEKQFFMDIGYNLHILKAFY